VPTRLLNFGKPNTKGTYFREREILLVVHLVLEQAKRPLKYLDFNISQSENP